MSGGTFNYLCWHLDPYELGSRLDDIELVGNELSNWPDAKRAANATWEVVRLLRAASRLASSLEDVWHDVEWWQSCDYSEDQARETAAAYVEPADDETPR